MHREANLTSPKKGQMSMYDHGRKVITIAHSEHNSGELNTLSLSFYQGTRMKTKHIEYLKSVLMPRTLWILTLPTPTLCSLGELPLLRRRCRFGVLYWRTGIFIFVRRYCTQYDQNLIFSKRLVFAFGHSLSISIGVYRSSICKCRI